MAAVLTSRSMEFVVFAASCGLGALYYRDLSGTKNNIDKLNGLHEKALCILEQTQSDSDGSSVDNTKLLNQQKKVDLLAKSKADYAVYYDSLKDEAFTTAVFLGGIYSVDVQLGFIGTMQKFRSEGAESHKWLSREVAYGMPNLPYWDRIPNSSTNEHLKKLSRNGITRILFRSAILTITTLAVLSLGGIMNPTISRISEPFIYPEIQDGSITNEV